MSEMASALDGRVAAERVAPSRPRPTAAHRWRAWLGVVAGLGAMAGLRIVLIHVNLWDTFYWEEQYRLTIATEILDGPHLPLAEYQADHYQGGSLAVGLLAVPFVATLGARFETLPLAFSVATGILWCVLLRVDRHARVFGHSPSLAVYPESGRFHCFGCGRHGDVITFLMVIAKLTFTEALRALEELSQHNHGGPPDHH
jgi:hypothetical protein